MAMMICFGMVFVAGLAASLAVGAALDWAGVGLLLRALASSSAVLAADVAVMFFLRRQYAVRRWARGQYGRGLYAADRQCPESQRHTGGFGCGHCGGGFVRTWERTFRARVLRFLRGDRLRAVFG